VRGQHDLDERGKQFGSRPAVLRVFDHATDRSCCRIYLALREAELGQSGLRTATVLVRLTVGFFRLRELASEAKKFRPLVEGRTKRGLASGLRQPFARPLRFDHGGGPGAMQLHEFGAPYQALTAIRHQVRL
jgi:hypothetical protein